MAEGVSEVEENNLRVLLATMRKYAPEALDRIVFDVLLAGVEEDSATIMLKGTDDDVGQPVDDDPSVDAAIIVIRGERKAAGFFRALADAGLDEAEDTELS